MSGVRHNCRKISGNAGDVDQQSRTVLNMWYDSTHLFPGIYSPDCAGAGLPVVATTTTTRVNAICKHRLLYGSLRIAEVYLPK